ncbi:7-methylguanosine phosphate-specific 5'-nucleotidase [Hondaea fermentalgiana]|uniref:5'-nucleotidase n=1 Tax=Hondaea fermentalgiana TaxID=2315210 RepID=A0A2R5G5J1_9STRA|nr:7-methylguanosine phosphate-specific 5'-nucleotidase [Hondaea fermentalgiana]|eukprot:GBG26307.1 7-methylguanosine phosphate-specific 5'-nucleotidase [Hondaea fermentalgiana]
MTRVHAEPPASSSTPTKSATTLAYSFAIVLRIAAPDEGIDKRQAQELHCALVQALIKANLHVGVLLETADTPEYIVLILDANAHEPSLTLQRELVRRQNAKLNVPITDEKLFASHHVSDLSPAEELVLTNCIIQQCLDDINTDVNGVARSFDVTRGGERSTPLESVVHDIFPLQDEYFNEAFLHSLGYSAPPNLGLAARLRARLLHVWHHWILQTSETMRTETLRQQFGDRISVSIEFLLHYRRCVLALTTLSTANYLLVRFVSWDAYVILLGVFGVFTCGAWGPWLARRWTFRFMTLARQWKSRHVVSAPGSILNPNVPASLREASASRRQRRRIAAGAFTMLFVAVNILLLVPVSLFFTQWYVFGKHAPTCECCEFLLYQSGIGSGSQAMEDVPESMWPPNCYREYFVHREEFPLLLATQPSDCRYWGVCFSHEAATVGTDRWVYILCQGIAMGLILDVFQTSFFRRLTFWLTVQEGHETLEDFHKFFVRKSFFFIWLNMFVWYLTITFLYVPFGAAIQEWLIAAGHGYIVPPWGWRADKIRLDEAFVTPVLVTSFVNGILETFVPSRIARLALSAKAARRRIIDPGSDSGGQPVRDSNAPALVYSAETLYERLITMAHKNSDGKAVVRQGGSRDTTAADSQVVEAEFCRQIHMFKNTPDLNKLNASEVILQSLLPRYSEHDDYLSIVIQMGYVCMFTSAWGLLPLAASCRLLFSFRGTCYRLMFASKRTVPMSALETPGEWLSALYATIWLAIPVISVQISLSTGALDVAYRVFGFDSHCAQDASEQDKLTPDWVDCGALTLHARVLIAGFLEHLCALLFVYTMSEVSATTAGLGTAVWAAVFAGALLSGVRKRHAVGAPSSQGQQKRGFHADPRDAAFKQGERILTDPEAAAGKIEMLKRAGKDKLRVVIDFDYTMTTFWVGEERGYSCHRTIEECGLLPDSYHRVARGLQEKYFPLEISAEISHEQKYKYMVEWVEKAHEALKEAGFRKEYVAEAVRRARVELRAGVPEFLSMLSKAGIPVLIFSAGIADVLEEVLRQRGQLYDNITIVSNKFCFNENGTLRGFEAELAGREPFQVLNKRFTHAAPEARQQLLASWGDDEDATVLLVGDSTGDVHMSEGLLSEDVRATRELKVGFLNFNVTERLEEYKEIYDALILNDGDFSFLNETLRQVLCIPDH